MKRIPPLTDEQIEEVALSLGKNEEKAIGHVPGLTISNRQAGYMFSINFQRKVAGKYKGFTHYIGSLDQFHVSEAADKALRFLEEFENLLKTTSNIYELKAFAAGYSYTRPEPKKVELPAATGSGEDLFNQILEERRRKRFEALADEIVNSEVESLMKRRRN